MYWNRRGHSFFFPAAMLARCSSFFRCFLPWRWLSSACAPQQRHQTEPVCEHAVELRRPAEARGIPLRGWPAARWLRSEPLLVVVGHHLVGDP
eukprot:4380434-Lingulodinium_polyedra.AAC.1